MPRALFCPQSHRTAHWSLAWVKVNVNLFPGGHKVLRCCHTFQPAYCGGKDMLGPSPLGPERVTMFLTQAKSGLQFLE